jgi:hypothetical protein
METVGDGGAGVGPFCVIVDIGGVGGWIGGAYRVGLRG